MIDMPPATATGFSEIVDRHQARECRYYAQPTYIRYIESVLRTIQISSAAAVEYVSIDGSIAADGERYSDAYGKFVVKARVRIIES